MDSLKEKEQSEEHCGGESRGLERECAASWVSGNIATVDNSWGQGGTFAVWARRKYGQGCEMRLLVRGGKRMENRDRRASREKDSGG